MQSVISRAANKFFHHIALSRYAYYFDVIINNPGYKEILFADVRDIIFQDDPFNFELESDLYFFLEDDKYNLRTQNYIWLKNLFGEEIFKRIGEDRVICSGTTYGKRDAMLHYCEQMCLEQLKHIHSVAGFDGYDQGVHNYLIHTGKFDKATLCENFKGPILTMHGVEKKRFVFNDAGKLINEDGHVIPVLHQYDRHYQYSLLENKLLLYPADYN
ncbi:MAG: hypothetical protein EOO93_03560 [Pedobacter sp.]|nr:MAG: hypothetical protein EOO93_03560 [Pedobacter sp.]